MPRTQNQAVLARLHTIMAMQKMRSGPVTTPQALLMDAVNEAIEDARRRKMQTLSVGIEESREARQLSAQIERWERARSANR